MASVLKISTIIASILNLILFVYNNENNDDSISHIHGTYTCLQQLKLNLEKIVCYRLSFCSVTVKELQCRKILVEKL